MIGWDSVSQLNAGIEVKKNVWVKIAEFNNIPLGPTVFHVQMYGTLPTVKPKNIESKWVRLNNPTDPNDDNFTGHFNHTVGTQAGWEGKDTNLEYVNAEDLPLEFWVRSDAVDTWIINTVIRKYLNPSAYIADRIV